MCKVVFVGAVGSDFLTRWGESDLPGCFQLVGVNMYINFGLWFEDSIVGYFNFTPWKEMVSFILKELELWEITKDVVMIPTSTDDLDEYNKKNVKDKCFLLDSFQDHLIPHVNGKKKSYEM